jgi:hypothetical protein
VIQAIYHVDPAELTISRLMAYLEKAPKVLELLKGF